MSAHSDPGHLLLVDLRAGRRKKIENPHTIKNYVTNPVLAKLALRGTL